MPTKTRCALAASVLCLTASGRAAAERTVRDAPTFATMDRQDGTSFLGGQFGFTFFDDEALGGPGAPDTTGLRFDLYGEYVGRRGVGFYAHLPFSRLFIEDVDDESALGNVEAGLIYIVRTGPGQEFVLHGGFTLPTADDSTDGGVFANQISTWPRLTDLADVWPQSVWFRAAVSPILQRGQLVLRADLGFDVALSSDDAFGEPDPFVRLNVGGGLDTGSFALLGELVTIGNVEDVISQDEDFLHTFALSARFRGETLEPGVAIGFPLDESVREFIDLFVIAGLQTRL